MSPTMYLVPGTDVRMVLSGFLLLTSSSLNEIKTLCLFSCLHRDYRLLLHSLLFFSLPFLSLPQTVFYSLLEDVTSNKKMLKLQSGWETCLPPRSDYTSKSPPLPHLIDPWLAIHQEVKGQKTRKALFPFFDSKEELA